MLRVLELTGVDELYGILGLGFLPVLGLGSRARLTCDSNYLQFHGNYP